MANSGPKLRIAGIKSFVEPGLTGLVYESRSGLIVLLYRMTPAAVDLRRMQMITEADAGQIAMTIIMMPGEIFNLKRAALAGIYSAAWRRLALANDRRASIG